MNGYPKKWSWPRQRPMTIEEAYQALRAECGNLEGLIESGPLSEKKAKRLDKAVVVIKAGLKIAKKAMRGEVIAIEEDQIESSIEAQIERSPSR